MPEHTARPGGTLERWESWLRGWLSPSALDLRETVGEDTVWSIEFSDGGRCEIRIRPAALHSDPDTFHKITDRLGSAHWIDVVHERDVIRIHENGWIEKVH